MKAILTAMFCLCTIATLAQKKTIREARYDGVKVLKPPYKGVWRVDVMEDYPNVVQVILCKDRRSVPLDCRKDYNVTMTTSTGRKKTITDYMNTSFGVIQPHEFPLTIDVSVTPLNTNNRLEYFRIVCDNKS